MKPKIKLPKLPEKKMTKDEAAIQDRKVNIMLELQTQFNKMFEQNNVVISQNNEIIKLLRKIAEQKEVCN